jgi:hypothetical protein
MRWPPVILTVRTSYFSAASAMARSCCGEVSPPKMRGITE